MLRVTPRRLLLIRATLRRFRRDDAMILFRRLIIFAALLRHGCRLMRCHTPLFILI